MDQPLLTSDVAAGGLGQSFLLQSMDPETLLDITESAFAALASVGATEIVSFDAKGSNDGAGFVVSLLPGSEAVPVLATAIPIAQARIIGRFVTPSPEPLSAAWAAICVEARALSTGAVLYDVKAALSGAGGVVFLASIWRIPPT